MTRSSNKPSARAAVAAPFVALRSLHGVPGVLRLQAVNALAVTGRWAEAVALTVAAFRIGGPELVAVAVIARKLPSALLSPMIGSSIERRAPLTVLRIAVAVAAVLAAVSAVAIIWEPGVIVAIAAGAGLGLCGVARRVANSVLAPTMVEDSAQLTGMAVVTRGIDAAGLAIGPAIAGVLVAVVGPAAAYLAVVVVNLGALVLLRHLHGAGTEPLRTDRTGRAGLVRVGGPSGSIARPLANPSVRRVVVLSGLQACVYGVVDVILAPLVIEELSIGEGGVGLLNAATGVGGVVALVPLFGIAGTRRLAQLLVLGLFLVCAPLLGLSWIGAAPYVAVALFAVVGFGDVVFLGTMVSTLQRASEPSMLGRSFALIETAQATGFVGGAVLGAVLTGWAPSFAIGLVAGTVAVAAVLSAPWARRLDRRLVPPEDVIAKLRAMPVFELLSAQAIERLAFGVEHRSFGPGERIITQGELGTTYFLVDEGVVDVAVDDVRVRQLGSGDGFGEIALMRVVPRTATCTAVTDVTVFTVDGDDFLAVLGHHSAALDAVAGQRLSSAAPRLWDLPRFE